MERRTALWLSPHWPEEYDRCTRVGRAHVCRRCLWFWPPCLLVAGLAVAGVPRPVGLDPWLLVLLPVPVVAEWWCEQLGLVRYSARRQVPLTLLAAVAVGVGLGRYLESPGDRLFWSVVAGYAVVCVAPVVIAGRRRAQNGSGSGTSKMLVRSTGGSGGSGTQSPGSGTGVSVTPDSRMRKKR